MAGNNIFPDVITPSSTVAATPANVSSLFGAINTAVTADAGAASQADLAAGDTALSTGDTALAAGDTAEAGAYGTAEGIANANARLATISGQVEQAQQGIQIRQTLGSQRAAVAGGGFQSAGSAVDLLASSTRQGLLEQQITGVNSQLQAGGFEQQGAAAAAEGVAATTAAAGQTAQAANEQDVAAAAAATGASDAAVGAVSKTNAINESAALGLSIPGLANLSGTNIPTVNPVTATTTNAAPGLPGSGSAPPGQANYIAHGI